MSLAEVRARLTAYTKMHYHFQNGINHINETVKKKSTLFSRDYRSVNLESKLKPLYSNTKKITPSWDLFP